MSTAISVGTATTYTLPNDWDHADRRLRLLEACHDPHTIARATALGVGPRWRCLEAGAGAGSIARWMSRQVGRRGHVLAVDIDTTLLSDTTAPNLEVRQLNLVTDQLPTSAFDFVHARLVLMHLAEREHVLDQLVGALRAGGIILLEEYDFACARATMSGPARPMLEGVLNVMEAGGARLDYGRTLPECLDGHGLRDVDATVDQPLVRGGSPLAQFLSLTALQVREPIIASGLDPSRFDAGQAALADPAYWFHGAAMVVAWGRRP
jgi:SAM-dependent methyltransferase